MEMKRIELLAPARDYRSAVAAVDGVTDANLVSYNGDYLG